MSHKEDIVAAIDIGTTKIVAIVGKRKENGKIEILGISKSNVGVRINRAKDFLKQNLKNNNHGK